MPVPDGRPSGYATASVIIGAASLLGCCFLIVPPFVGLILGVIAMTRTPRTNRRAATWAVTGTALNGFVCAALPLLLAIGAMADRG